MRVLKIQFEIGRHACAGPRPTCGVVLYARRRVQLATGAAVQSARAGSKCIAACAHNSYGGAIHAIAAVGVNNEYLLVGTQRQSENRSPNVRTHKRRHIESIISRQSRRVRRV